MDRPDELINVTSSDVEFMEEISLGNNSDVYKVKVRGRICAMKVHHGELDLAYPQRQHELFAREVTAYRIFKERGLCARGVVPDFYGFIPPFRASEWPNMLPSPWDLIKKREGFEDPDPHLTALYRFVHDDAPSTAIFLEYIPDMVHIDIECFSDARLAKLGDILHEFHTMRILHLDTHPRNMMVVEGKDGREDRILWIDFDSVWIRPPDTDMTRQLFEEEAAKMRGFIRALTMDYRSGKWYWSSSWDYFLTYT